MSRIKKIIRNLRGRIPRACSEAPQTSGDTEADRYRLVAENARDIIWLLEFPNTTTYVSPACKEILGWSPSEQLGREGGLQMLTADSAERAGRLLQDAIRQRLPSVTYEAEHNRADGSTIWCEVHQGISYDDQGNAVSSVGVTRDISEKRALEAQLATAQRTEALGTLAGGVAHDFNNFLTVIIGSLDLISRKTVKDEATSELIADALDAAGKSAALTAQLLAFSRHQPTSVEPFDVNSLILSSEGVMKRLVGVRIGIESRLPVDLPMVLADEHQVEQVLINLILNARDAIEAESGGLIQIDTSELKIGDDTDEPRSGLIAGRYIAIRVSDNGSGMSEDVRLRATDAFYSTKPKGQGTGLGLAMAKKLLERFDGGIEIDSEVGRGTSITAYLPVARAHSISGLHVGYSQEAGTHWRGDETILVVEDNDAVRSVSIRILEQAGYRVVGAADPKEALHLLNTAEFAQSRPDLVLTDLVMPGMSGTELAERIRESDPDMPFVVMSGYTEAESSVAPQKALAGPLVPKPFHPNELLRAVRSQLDRRGQ